MAGCVMKGKGNRHVPTQVGSKNWQKSKRIPNQLSSSQLDRGIYKEEEEELTSRSWSVLLGQAEGVVIYTVGRCVALAIDTSIHRIVERWLCGKGPGKPPIQSPVKRKQNKAKKKTTFCLVPLWHLQESRVSVQAHLSAELFQLSLPSYKKFHLSLSSSFSLLLFPSHSTPSRKNSSLSLPTVQLSL